MEIKINETGEIKRITLIDLKTGVDWSGDYMESAESGFDGDYITMSQENFDWWNNQCNEYQKADEAVYELLNRAETEEEEIKKNKLTEQYHDFINGVEFNEQPEAMIKFVDENSGK